MSKTTQQIFEYLVESVADCDASIRKELDLNEAVDITKDRDVFAVNLIKHVLANQDALLEYYSLSDVKGAEKPSLTQTSETLPAENQEITSVGEDV